MRQELVLRVLLVVLILTLCSLLGFARLMEPTLLPHASQSRTRLRVTVFSRPAADHVYRVRLVKPRKKVVLTTLYSENGT